MINNIFYNNQFLTEITSPLDQFKIFNLLSIDLAILNNIQISLTNIGLYLTIGVFLAIILSLLLLIIIK